mgnify:FL=1
MAKTLIRHNNKEHFLYQTSRNPPKTSKMKSLNPSISIIVPIYNREQWLSDCLDSILAQTFTNWECILVDDGSTDNSLKIAQEYAANDERFIVFSQENQGVSAARNLGLDHAQGKWLAFVDSDDEIAPDYLEILYKLGEDNNADLVNASCIYHYNGNKKLAIILNDTIYTYQEEDFGNYFNSRMPSIIKLYRLDLVKEHHLRFETKFHFAEDLIFCIEFYLRAQRFATSSKAIYKYYIRDENQHQLHKQFYDFQTEIELYNRIVSYYKQITARYPHGNKQLIFRGLTLDRLIDRLLGGIECQTKTLIQRYKMYRSIKLPIRRPEEGSLLQRLRFYLLYKQQYFLFALSRIWVNRH